MEQARWAQALEAVKVVADSNRSASYSTRARSAKTGVLLRDTPQSATVISRQLIADQSMQGMADAVRYIPGVTMGQGEGHRDAPTIRGQSSTADFYVDGVRDDAQYFRDLYNVERLEAHKGPNALLFGRGGGGGIINRVSKEAFWSSLNAATFEAGSFGHARGTVDVNRLVSARLAARLNGLVERSGGFRDGATVRRSGLNPTVTFAAGPSTRIRAEYEAFEDDRNVDRGIPSFRGEPSPAPRATFFGDQSASYSHATVNAAGLLAEHSIGALTIRNRTRAVSYDKFYSNVYPGSVNAAGTQLSLSGYNSATGRANLFNQTDIVYAVLTGRVLHNLLVGSEFARQSTDNVRQTAYFANGATSVTVPFNAPSQATSPLFRPSASDADNHARTDVASVYAQDQIVLGSAVQAVIGARLDQFSLRFHDNRSAASLQRDDRMLSPRAALVLKPREPLSLYGSYSVSHLPSSGDQFSSLTVTTQSLEPERFATGELGAKWEPSAGLSLSAALFQIDRTNSASPDPVDPRRTVQTGAQRTTGYEVGASGNPAPRWAIAGGLSAQTARITRTTSAAREGTTVPLVPRTTMSLWNKLQLSPAAGIGLGVVHQTRMYAALDNAVTLPAFTRVDGGVYLTLGSHWRAQLNVENLLDARYFPTSHGNNNILPGAPRSLRVSLGAR